MSITKVEKAKGELISQPDIDSERISDKTSRCSCLDCDSEYCFEKRKKPDKENCRCNICRYIKNKSTSPNKDCCENEVDLELGTKKIIREVVTRETIESLKRVTETMYEFKTKPNCGMIKERLKPSDKKIMSPSKSDIGIKISDVDSNNLKKERLQRNSGRPIMQSLSMGETEPHKENTATKLSAQVMNVPYEEIRETVPSSRDVTERSPLSKLDIFRRIKEIYDACSCKVCECISSKPQMIREEFCNCEPCQCQDCVKLRIKIEEKIKSIPHGGCPCVQCDKKNCRGIAKTASKPPPCDCGPEIQYPESLTDRCKCVSCQCVECSSSRLRVRPKTVKLGSVDAYIQGDTCLCLPCECIECKHNNSRSNPTVMCSHAPDGNKYGNFCRCPNCTERCQFGSSEICKCGTHNKCLRKTIPFYKNYKDYDIRTVIVDNNGPFIKEKESDLKINDTVALFASLKNKYQNNSCNKSVCKCTECECIVCSAKDDSSIHSDKKMLTPIMNACKCAPCECEVCSKRGNHPSIIPLEKKCRCDVCDCMNCDNLALPATSFPSSSKPYPAVQHPYRNDERQPAKPIKIIDRNKNCDCNHCTCINCKKLFSCSSSVKFYSGGKSVGIKSRRSRKVTLITPSSSESHLKSQKIYVQSVSSTALSPKQSNEDVFEQVLPTCHVASRNYAPDCYLHHTNKKEVCQLYQDNRETIVISDDDVDGEMFFKLNNPMPDAGSFRSTEETPTLNCTYNLSKSPFKSHNKLNKGQDEPNEKTYEHFYNINQEQRVKITSNDSDEMLPVYWACYDGTSYPQSSLRNITITCKRRPNKKQDNFNEKPKEDAWNRVFEDNDTRDEITKYVKDSYLDAHYSYNDEDEQSSLHQETQSYTDIFNKFLHQECRKTSVNHSGVSIDYGRATRVLWEAKAFSSKLIKMLDSFDNANKQFESASQKFKVLHESLLNINDGELNKAYSPHILENTFEIIKEQSADDGVKDENEPEREYEKPTIKSEDKSDNFHCTENLRIHDAFETNHVNEIIEEEKNTKKEEKYEIETFNNSNEMQYPNLQSESGKDSIIQNSSRSQLSQICTSSNLHSSQSNFNEDLTNKMEIKNTENNTQSPTLKMVIDKLDLVFGNITTTDTSVATDDLHQDVDESSQEQDKKTWQIFKKNLYLNPCPQNKKTIFQSSALELDVKEAIQVISLHDRDEKYAKIVPRPNEALANLQSEVNDLLNMPLLQSKYKGESDVHMLPRSKLDLEVKSYCSTASSQTYDQIIEKADKEVYFNNSSDKVSSRQLKANFIGLRKVSDHTVLVKWKVPERVVDVQGYELLVDGRPVQKILNPSRNMAIVTCLPPSPRLLLTIRTIIPPECGHAPASTIVYRPRMKQ